MNATKTVTIRVTTAPGTNASKLGDVYGHFEGVAWRNSVDRCDSDGCGRVFLDCDDANTADFIESELDNDDRVKSYTRD
jgi:hypothetical protein